MYAQFVHRTVLITLLALAYPAASFAGFFGVGVTVGFAPPPLPVYVQPPCPASGYIWTPGYWAYSADDEDYYWVPGSWVLAPSFGLLWTPGYWGLVDAAYVWHEGYWGPHVGFYGGISYGFGYFGTGFVGGYWRDRDFYYNRAVTNISNVNITNVYNRTVINNNYYGSRASFNGRNGVEARPSHSDLVAAREPHRALTEPQRAQTAAARALPSSLASVNHGHPQTAATPRPAVLNGLGVRAPRSVNSASAPSPHPTLADRSQGLRSTRNAALRSPIPDTHSRSPVTHQDRPSLVHTQQHLTASAAQRGGFGPAMMRSPVAQSRTPVTPWSPPASHRPAQPYRAGPSYVAAPKSQAFSQAPHNAPAFHRDPQPPRVDHETAARNQRHS
ncbi:MAG TPA: hypothetical protein VN325_07670 [Steroidobacteraceae bacterium]|nr:hypothetical protein [Steroidobacteraceae bacterium]